MKRVILIYLVGILLQGCNGCSKSGRYKAKNQGERSTPVARETNNRNSIKMEKVNGVYQIPILVNGTTMFFIFDTGASLISISNVEATFLFKQGKLTEDDIIGKANFTDANGDISEGTIIRLKEIKIGNKILNDIEASVVNNTKAPLLFGQSALEKFGKISIDYNSGELVFDSN